MAAGRRPETSGRLPAGHDDPFDLLLVAVAQTENLRLLTADRKLLSYAGAPPLAEIVSER